MKIFIISFLLFFYMSFSVLSKSSLPENSATKLNFIKKSMALDKKYLLKEQPDLFKKILIGKWEGHNIGEIKFYVDGRLKRIYTKNGKEIVENGKWVIRDGGLMLKYNFHKAWLKYEVKFFKYYKVNLKKIPLFKRKSKNIFPYHLSIVFSDYTYEKYDVSGIWIDFR